MLFLSLIHVSLVLMFGQILNNIFYPIFVGFGTLDFVYRFVLILGFNVLFLFCIFYHAVNSSVWFVSFSVIFLGAGFWLFYLRHVFIGSNKRCTRPGCRLANTRRKPGRVNLAFDSLKTVMAQNRNKISKRDCVK